MNVNIGNENCSDEVAMLYFLESYINLENNKMKATMYTTRLNEYITNPSTCTVHYVIYRGHSILFIFPPKVLRHSPLRTGGHCKSQQITIIFIATLRSFHHTNTITKEQDLYMHAGPGENKGTTLGEHCTPVM